MGIYIRQIPCAHTTFIYIVGVVGLIVSFSYDVCVTILH